MKRVLIAGVGNIFLGDDGFGVEVANRLAKVDLPDWVAVGDYGISGMHLAYDLADGVQTAILIDAVPRGEEPGTVYVIEPEWRTAASSFFDGHGMQPEVVLGLLDSLGGQVSKVLLVGCEPATTDELIGLSAPVAAAVDNAVNVVLELIGQLDAGGRKHVPRDSR